MPRWLNLELRDSSGVVLAGRRYVIELGDERREGTLDADGRVSIEVPEGHVRAGLVVAYRRLELRFDDFPDASTVEGAQERLNHLNFFVGNVDGQHGTFTAGALRRFQRAHGLPETGELDPDTIDRLREEHGS